MGRTSRVLLQTALTLAVIFLTLVIGGCFILAIGKDPLDIYAAMLEGTLGNPYGVGQVLFKATTFTFTGLAAATAFRTGLFSIGAEGQLTVGAFAMAVAGTATGNSPPAVAIPLCLLAGGCAGALWGALPGYLRARYGAHEVINTMMMNFIAAGLVSYFVNGVLNVPATVHTPPIAAAAEISRLGDYFSFSHGSPANLSIIVCALGCVFVYFLFRSSRIGYEMNATGLSPVAALYNGIPTSQTTVIAMAISGAIAGVGGCNFVLGYKHYYEIGFSDGAGFIGIAVALLAKNHPVGIVLASLFFGVIEYGGLTVNTVIPKDIMHIMQGLIILLTLVLAKAGDRMLGRFVAARNRGLAHA